MIVTKTLHIKDTFRLMIGRFTIENIFHITQLLTNLSKRIVDIIPHIWTSQEAGPPLSFKSST